MFKEKLAVIIATKDRPEKLRRLLKSISAQDAQPVQIVIVDGGDVPCKKLSEEFPDLKIDYERLVPASLTAQRNAGIRKICAEATLAGFLDDDIVLEEGAIRHMMAFWETAPEDTGGAAFNLVNEIYKRPGFLEKLFLVNAEKPSRILRSGFQSKVSFQDKTIEVEWIAGCSMVWRKVIFDDFMFDEQFTGYARYEEVDFSYRVGRKCKMFIVADAKVRHLNKPEEDIDFSFSLGKMETFNRLYFVRKNAGFGLSMPLCLWASFGLFLNNIIKGLFNLNRRYLLRSKGNIVGFYLFIKIRRFSA